MPQRSSPCRSFRRQNFCRLLEVSDRFGVLLLIKQRPAMKIFQAVVHAMQEQQARDQAKVVDLRDDAG